MNVALTIVFLGLLIFAAHYFASVFEQRRIPDVLMLIIVGIIIGPLTGLVKLSDFGNVGQIFVAFTLVIILFEGGTSISFQVLKQALKGTARLVLISFLSSVFIIALFSWYYLGFSIVSALLLGSILGGTSSAVVIPLVRLMKVREDVRTILILESAITDVLCIVAALAFLESSKAGQTQFGLIIGKVLASFILASVVGFGGAIFWSGFLHKIRSVKNSIFTTPAFVFVLYGLSELLGYSGAITALAFGITIANIDEISFSIFKRLKLSEAAKLNDLEMAFFRELVFLLKTFFFVYIGLSIVLTDLTAFYAGGILITAVYIARLILSKYFSPSKSNSFDKSVISIMIPKGLAAAVLAGLPLQQGVPEGMAIQNITYSTVLLSILVSSALVLLVEKSTRVNLFYRKVFRTSRESEKTDISA